VTSVAGALAAIGPALGARADDIAALRRLPDDVVSALRDAGAFRIAAPRALGGPEMTPREQTEVIETLSVHEASVGWCTMIGSDGPYYGSFLGPDAAAELWPSIDAVTAGQIPPSGQARRVDGGYLVSGRWAFGSGCNHADVIVGGCVVMDGDAPAMVDGSPDVLVACAPASSWAVLDTWDTTGLAGSGSNDYTVTDLFVPERHVFRFADPPQRPEPLFAWPGMFFVNVPGVPLGVARRAIDVAAAIAAEKTLVPEMVLLRDTSRAKLAIAHAEAALGAARAYVYEALDALWDALCADETPTIDVRVALGLSRAHAFHVAVEVTQSMSALIGASSIYRSHPLERLVRDAITMSRHIVAQERMYELVGDLRMTGASTMPIL
jgi:alkylation response protein AidB-like acyl-CoA dehydrogenase